MLVLAGCERGCLSTWLGERGLGERAPLAKGSLPIQSVDCPDGLARCTDGVVAVSRAYSYPMPCKGLPPERCVCPWENLGACERGCVVDALDVVMPKARAVEQLCAPQASGAGILPAFASPPPAHVDLPPDACDEELYRCEGGSVVRCADPPVPLAGCRHGCTEESAALDDEGVGAEQAVAILCVH